MFVYFGASVATRDGNMFETPVTGTISIPECHKLHIYMHLYIHVQSHVKAHQIEN